MIKLGTKVKDSITGFEGIATSRVEYLIGCTQIGITPPVDKDGKVPDVVYLDEYRLNGTDLRAKALSRIRAARNHQFLSETARLSNSRAPMTPPLTCVTSATR